MHKGAAGVRWSTPVAHRSTLDNSRIWRFGRIRIRSAVCASAVVLLHPLIYRMLSLYTNMHKGAAGVRWSTPVAHRSTLDKSHSWRFGRIRICSAVCASAVVLLHPLIYRMLPLYTNMHKGTGVRWSTPVAHRSTLESDVEGPTLAYIEPAVRTVVKLMIASCCVGWFATWLAVHEQSGLLGFRLFVNSSKPTFWYHNQYKCI